MALTIPEFEGRRVLVVGDLMLDEYVWGEVDRISPEAPVQVVSVAGESFTLGGAGNVASNLAALGASVSVVGVIGDGPDGTQLLDRFRELGVDTRGVIRETGRRTTRKTRVIAASQHVVRIDRETRMPVSENTTRRLVDHIAESLPEADIVLLSDYAKGLLTPAFTAKVIEAAKRAGRMILCDPKGTDFGRYRGVTLLTPNRREAALASGVEIEDDESLDRAARKLIATADLRLLLVTLGREGMALFAPGQAAVRIPARSRQVYDVSGAGDTVLSVLGLCLASGLPPAEGARLANVAAGIVVGKVGTATITREELSAAAEDAAGRLPGKHVPIETVERVMNDLRSRGKRIVLTNGCFDLLHAGHIRLFSACRELGDVLVAALDDDEAVRRLKGPGRPVIGQRERLQVVGALDSVDYVVLFSEGELSRVIRAVRPHVLAKGSNYAEEEVVGRNLVESLGGKVVRIPLVDDLSASHIIDNIRAGGTGRDR